MTYIKSDEFIQIATEHNQDPVAMLATIKETNSRMTKKSVIERLARYRRKGNLPIDSGNYVSHGEVLKGTSTLYDDEGNVVIQWVKSDVGAQAQLDSIAIAIQGLSSDIKPLKAIPNTQPGLDTSQTTVYVTNDLHLGMLAWEPETGADWNLKIGIDTAKEAIDHLVSASPPSRYAIVVDLGDITEADNFSNTTPKSGNPLDTDSRYPKVLRAAYELLIYNIQTALAKHELVYFYNVAGNHDGITATAIREIILQAFKNEPRVVCCESPSPIKYHQKDKLLLQFFHGDCMKMKDAGEVMVADCQSTFSDSEHRFSLCGHNHKDSVIDTRLCRVESFRNLPGLNSWAHAQGYRRQLGTMKAITYHHQLGEVSRVNFNVI